MLVNLWLLIWSFKVTLKEQCLTSKRYWTTLVFHISNYRCINNKPFEILIRVLGLLGLYEEDCFWLSEFWTFSCSLSSMYEAFFITFDSLFCLLCYQLSWIEIFEYVMGNCFCSFVFFNEFQLRSKNKDPWLVLPLALSHYHFSNMLCYSLLRAKGKFWLVLLV